MSIQNFSQFEILTATFTVESATLEQDLRGNWRPADLSVTATAMMGVRRVPIGFRPPGADSNAMYLQGYLVTPSSLIARVQPDSLCTAIYHGLSGTFLLRFTGRNQVLKDLDIDLVEEIKGWFLPNSFVLYPP